MIELLKKMYIFLHLVKDYFPLIAVWVIYVSIIDNISPTLKEKSEYTKQTNLIMHVKAFGDS
jgi:hypothetical protein